MADTGIIYVIAAGCSIFGIVTAYLIYNFVQQEKAQYYKYKLRKEQMKKDRIDYNYTAPKEKKRKLSGPVVGVSEEPEKPKSRDGVPIPAPILAPVHLPPLPTATPPAAAPEPAREPSPPANQNNDLDFPFSSTAAAAVTMGGAAGVGAFATYEVARTYPEPEENHQNSNNKTNKKKRKGSIKKVAEEDFDDYRNFTPTTLPPPKGAPPKANYTSSGNEAPKHQPSPSGSVESLTVESGRRRGLELPRVAMANRDGLAF